MATKRRLFIPTFIRDEEYKPAQVSPRMFYYNGLLDSETWFIEGYIDGTDTIKTEQYSAIPYIDHYSSGSETTPDISSKSLLFFNETNPYGSQPAQNLYSEYWENYVRFLYNPRTRLVKVSAVIPLAEYFETQLNDLITFRGNLYQLRAINDYNIKDGTCKLELLGPVDRNVFDTIANEAPIPPTTTAAPTTSTTSTSTTTTPPLSVEYAVVAGGGGGGTSGGAGGGAGGFITGSTTISTDTFYPVFVGAGGSGGPENRPGLQGGNSEIFSIIATGGGGGAAVPEGYREGGNGGSGGGAFGIGVGGTGVVGQGNDGGNGADQATGGGGGASQEGQDGQGFRNSGVGGDGSILTWMSATIATNNTIGEVVGSDVYFAGGGGGGDINGGGGDDKDGGLGGGGNSNGDGDGDNGIENTGGGGGGASNEDGGSPNYRVGGNGGSGVVIVRYSGTPQAIGGTIVQDGGYTYHIFKSNGTLDFTTETSTTTTIAPPEPPNIVANGSTSGSFESGSRTYYWYSYDLDNNTGQQSFDFIVNETLDYVDVFAIGGGGSGQFNLASDDDHGSGGGGGQVSQVRGTTLSANTYNVFVGKGGVAPNPETDGNNGETSTFDTILTALGGQGGRENNGDLSYDGGASGQYRDDSSIGAGGAGFNSVLAGGGGGQTADGGDASSQNAGNGGAGLLVINANTEPSTLDIRGGGGGGCAYTDVDAFPTQKTTSGGSFGGGDGLSQGVDSQGGGGGGGGVANTEGFRGGSGKVAIMIKVN